jgi:hypothetical protein
MKNIRLIGIVLAVAIILLVPLIAGFPWTLLDFVVAGVMLLGTGFSCELVWRKVKKIEYRIALCGAILGALLLLWAAIVSAE